jgi:hypothetical protein
MPNIATQQQSDALEQYVDELKVDVIKEIFTNHSLEDLQELLEYHTQRENNNICAAIRDCIEKKIK